MSGILWYAVGSTVSGAGGDSTPDCEFILRHFNAQEATRNDLTQFQECNAEVNQVEQPTKDYKPVEVDLSHAWEPYGYAVIVMVVIGFILGGCDVHKTSQIRGMVYSIIGTLVVGSGGFWGVLFLFKFIMHVAQ